MPWSCKESALPFVSICFMYDPIRIYLELLEEWSNISNETQKAYFKFGFLKVSNHSRKAVARGEGFYSFAGNLSSYV